MNKDHPRIQTREEWLAAAKPQFPHLTEKQLDQMWEAAQKADNERRFYERQTQYAR